MSGTRLGIYVDGCRAAAAVRAGELADELGLDAVWVDCGDRLEPDERHAEVLAVLAALAARTRDVRLGAVLGELVSVLPHLAEDVGVVDQATGGRLELIVSAGDAPAFNARVREMQAAWRGTAIADGRILAVTPRPHQPAIPMLAITGSAAVVANCARRCVRREDLALLTRADGPPLVERTVVLVDGETWLPRLRAHARSELLALRHDLAYAEAAEVVIRLDPQNARVADDIGLLAMVAGPVLRAASEDEAVLLADDATAWWSRPASGDAAGMTT